MTIQTDDTSADTFWPGYVDAVTNLVLNLLFVVLIMTVAVFVLALEMGRQQIATPMVAPENTPPQQTASQDQSENRPADQAAVNTEIRRLKDQISSMQSKEAQLRSLESKLQAMEKAARQQSGSNPQKDRDAGKPADEGERNAPAADQRGAPSDEPPTVISASSSARVPQKGLEKLAPAGSTGGILVKFADDAIALTRNETEELRKALGPVLASGGAKIEVVVPTGFSEAKRLGFYRAMAVRNQLIELKVPAKYIELSVREGSNGSDSSRVMVTPR